MAQFADNHVAEVEESGLLRAIIIIVAIAGFVGLSAWLLPSAIQNLTGVPVSVDRNLSAALLLNIALIMLVWRRSGQLATQKKVAVAAAAKTAEISFLDHTTKLLNRSGLTDVMEKNLDAGLRLGLLTLDLDNFKKVNDLHGHIAGDELLKAVAVRLHETAPAGSFCARLGGDEFAILLIDEEAEHQSALAMAKKVEQAIAEPVEFEDGSAKVSASVGVYSPSEPGEPADIIFRRSDIAMYQAKEQNGVRVAVFAKAREEEAKKRSRMESEMRVGIAAGEFVPFYQPLYGIRGANLLGFEVLARWNHPSGDVIEPAEFIPLAESAGMISQLSEVVMRQALLDAANWDHNLVLAINISPIQLNDPLLDQRILKLLTETGFPAGRLELEITESALFNDTEVAIKTITSLKEQGIKISLDDFGTGYSSMTQLANLPFDRIKIDRSFVLSMLENSESAAIVNSITTLASSLKVPITAEGIESDEIREYLDTIGCTDGQGWLYGRPASKEELIKALPGIAMRVSADDVEMLQTILKEQERDTDADEGVAKRRA